MKQRSLSGLIVLVAVALIGAVWSDLPRGAQAALAYGMVTLAVAKLVLR